MYYSGFADEAGAELDTQLRATLELGWNAIESRNVDGVNLTDISDGQFDWVCQRLAETGLQIDCFGSAIANWSKDPRSDEDFEYCLAALERAIPRMQRLGTHWIRGMSFTIVRDEQPDSPALEQLIFSKLRRMVQMCEAGGVVYLHENCKNYGGLSHEHTLKLVEAINSPAFGLVFDPGNAVSSDRRIGSPPYPKQTPWEFYGAVKPWVRRLHVKDGIYLHETGQLFPAMQHTFPAEGQGDLPRIMADLLKEGFDGAFSIEPHMALVYHEGETRSPVEIQYATYVEYGQRTMQLVDRVRAGL